MKPDAIDRWPAFSLAAAFVLAVLATTLLPAPRQTGVERFWIAGRYDGNRVIVYFDAVKFGDTFPKDAGQIAYPIADAFFDPMVLAPDYVARFQKGSQSERFAVGDRYDLLLGKRGVTTVTIKTLVGFASDEAVGNHSFIGALAEADQPEELLFTGNYYVLRRRLEPPLDHPRPKFDPNAPVVGLDPDTVPFAIEAKTASALMEWLKTASIPEDVKRQAAALSPSLTVRRFTTASGMTRYHVWADWRLESGPTYQSIVRVAAWMSPTPALHAMAVEPPGLSEQELQKQDLLNVVDLGAGRTGVLVYIEGQDGRGVHLLEYKDGVGLKGMREIQSIAVGE